VSGDASTMLMRCLICVSSLFVDLSVLLVLILVLIWVVLVLLTTVAILLIEALPRRKIGGWALAKVVVPTTAPALHITFEFPLLMLGCVGGVPRTGFCATDQVFRSATCRWRKVPAGDRPTIGMLSMLMMNEFILC
jgi:hypothetical protein